jgi:hypothetical protein
VNRAHQFLLVLWLLALSCPLARAEDSVANPKYLAWSKFKPGSSETFEADIQSQGTRYHIQTTQTLVSLSDDAAVVETVSTATVQGQKPNQSTKRETFKARAGPTDLKQLGEKEVDAMGKTFKCKVFEGTGKPAAAANANPTAMKGTIYISDDVPGGLVRLDAVGADGKIQTFILTAMDAK